MSSKEKQDFKNEDIEAPVRRRLLAAIGGVTVLGAASPVSWKKPVIDSVILPAHAVTSVAASASSGDVRTEPEVPVDDTPPEEPPVEPEIPVDETDPKDTTDDTSGEDSGGSDKPGDEDAGSDDAGSGTDDTVCYDEKGDIVSCK